MIRGTTPKHTFTLPFSTESVASIRILYRQNKQLILTKTGEDVVLTGNTAEVTLTQEDTLAFTSGHKVEIQVRVLTLDDTALASDIYTVSVGCCLEDEVIA